MVFVRSQQSSLLGVLSLLVLVKPYVGSKRQIGISEVSETTYRLPCWYFCGMYSGATCLVLSSLRSVVLRAAFLGHIFFKMTFRPWNEGVPARPQEAPKFLLQLYQLEIPSKVLSQLLFTYVFSSNAR